MRVRPLALSGQRRLDEARRQAINLYVVRGPFDCHCLGELRDRRLRHAVDADICNADVGRHRPDVDNLAAAALTPMESSTLAAMIPSPRIYDPVRHPKRVEQRARRIRRWM